MENQTPNNEVAKGVRKFTLAPCYACAIALSLTLIGCQNADDQYQVVTEEISQPAESHLNEEAETAQTATDSDAQIFSPQPIPEDSSPNMNDREDENSAEVVIDSQSTTEQTSVAKDSDTSSNSEDAGGNQEEVRTTEKVQGFINLEEEIARQERLKKLGLGESIEPAEPREPKLLVEEREFSKERESDAWRVSYDDLDLLKILNMEPVPLNAVDYLPDWLTQLEGKRVILRGWMFPPDRSEGIKGFIFVRDNQVCCFGPNAKAYDKLTARLKSGTTSKFIQGRPFDVIGTFKIDPWIEDERDLKTGEFIEKIGMLYHLEDAEIVDKK